MQTGTESPESINIDFQQYWLSLKRRWLPAAAVFGSVVALATVMASFQKPVYTAEGKLLWNLDRNTSLIGLGKEIEQNDSLGQQSNQNPINTQMEVIRSTPIIKKTINALQVKDRQGNLIKPGEIQGKLKLKNIPGTDVVMLSYSDKNPQQAALVVNKLMSLYIENNILTNRAKATAAGEFIAKQLPKNEATVSQAEAALRKFEEENNIVNIQEESVLDIHIVKDLESKITQTRAELADANSRSVALRSKVGLDSQTAIDASSLSNSPEVRNVLQELQQVESSLAVEQTRFTEASPQVIELKDKEAALKKVLQEQIAQVIGSHRQVSAPDLHLGELKQKLIEDLVKSEVERLGMEKQLASLSNAQSEYKQRLNIIPKLQQKYRDLQRKLDAAQSTYEILLKNLQEVRVAENQNIGNARIIETAEVPDSASKGNKIIILTIGGMIGIVLATAIVVILEVRDTSIKNLKEIRELFKYTLLGVIPALKNKALPRGKNIEWTIPELPVRDTPQLPHAEAYRMLQANLKFLSSDKPLQTIVVTSSVPKEGKSTVSANLAAAIAQLGRRVLLVDTNMRQPMQHHIWQLTNAGGLSDAIVGQAEFGATVAEVMTNLDVLTAGVIPPNPLALLDSKRMAGLIEDFSKTYDFVIFDAPSLIVAADAVTLSKMTDGVLLVVRPGVVDSHRAAVAKESLERSGQHVLGLVVNGLFLEKEPDSYFYYAQGYSTEIASQPASKHKRLT